MSFLKGLGQFAGEVTGKVLGGTVRVVGEVAGSPFIKEIGNGVEKATINTGKTAGQLASGAFDVAKGMIKQDGDAIDNGLSDIGGAVATTAVGVATSAKYVYNSGKDVVVGIKEDDYDKVKSGAKGLVTAAAVSVIAVGLFELIDVADGGVESADLEADAGVESDLDSGTTTETVDIEQNVNPDSDVVLTENPNTHNVDAHYVHEYTRADGVHVEGYFRDGDGNTSIDNPDGEYEQSNPDYKSKA
ncbi:hypothetical protein [Paenibacillus sp. PL91]|uniref:hypothetical protein n=1 Tax=Paenibacillus sp. PL91 TaxID=2729538 RepID=UPI00165994F2|nr:hypothetical protein [Paenibacillus sp. PL91]MBC9199796.1 hypothetical protein [Paenibacillus sp. PL91]